MEAMSVDGVAFNVWWHWEKAGRDRYKTGAHTQCTRCGSSLSHCGEHTPVNRMVWEREHGQDLELWCGTELLATAKPDGSWCLCTPNVDGTKTRGQEPTIEAAKAAARKACKR